MKTKFWKFLYGAATKTAKFAAKKADTGVDLEYQRQAIMAYKMWRISQESACALRKAGN